MLSFQAAATGVRYVWQVLELSEISDYCILNYISISVIKMSTL